MYEKQIEKIPGFEKTPDELRKVKDVNNIFRIANINMPVNIVADLYWKNAENIKKLLDDRRQLTQLCLAMYRLLFYPYEKNQEIFETEVWKILKKVTGKSIDKLLKDD